ncbi:MAG: phage major capsid protein [Oscillospiraceae bacterium]|nr:phage major capsid protein [Oscillospiraceae bacterium]
MSKILELREKRARLWETAKNFLDSKRGADGLVSAEDAASYDKMEADMVALGKEIERLERQAAHDLELSKATSNPITGTPGVGGAPEEKTGRASAAYNTAFWAALRQKPYIHNDLSVGVDTEGGYLVPEEFEKRIIRELDEFNIVRSLAKVIQTGSERKIPLAASYPSATWTEEGQAITFSDASFGQASLGAYKMAVAIKVSNELLNDSVFSIEQYVAETFARASAIAEEQAFLVGDGVNKPTGLLNTTGGGTLAVTTASSTAVTFDEVISLIYALKSPYRRGASFVTNDATVALLRKLKDGNGMYLWQPSVQAGQPDRLLGYPLHTSPYVPLVAAGAVTLAFGDYAHYWIADRGGRVFKRLDELFATTDQTGFIGTARVDGKVILREAIQLLQMKA